MKTNAVYDILVKMKFGIYLSVLVFGAFLDTIVQATVICGDITTPFINTCYGDEAYCCGIYSDHCCFHSYVYSFWWFWFIWFWVILLIVSCSIWICRRRRQRMAMPYVIVEPQQTYGTVVQSSNVYSSADPAVPTSVPSYQ